MTTTAHLSLPYLAPGQAQKHVTVNESLRRLDALVHINIVSDQLQSPPETPEEGARYIIPADAANEWSGHIGEIAAFQDGAWIFIQPGAGWSVWSLTQDNICVWDGSSWRSLSDISATQQTEFLGINSTADVQNRLTVSADGSLFYGQGGSHRISVSKQAEADTASLVFQENFTGHAEIGLTGDNDLQVKVSRDGLSWENAVRIDQATGYVGLNTAPEERLTISDGFVQLGYSVYSANENLNFPAFDLMSKASGHRNAYFDMHACDEWTNYSSRLIRFAGPNSTFQILNRGVGGISLTVEDAGPVKLETQNVTRLFVKGDGRVGIGTTTPSTQLHVEGPVRVGQYSSGSLPDAFSAGEGAVIYVTDAPTGPGLKVSNGTAWI